MIRAHAAGGTTDGDSVADVIEHLLCEFEDQLDSGAIFRVVLSCRAELTACPHHALPERMRRLAHRRLSAVAPAVRVALSTRHPTAGGGPDAPALTSR
jgi:hypothetical protein